MRRFQHVFFVWKEHYFFPLNPPHAPFARSARFLLRLGRRCCRRGFGFEPLVVRVPPSNRRSDEAESIVSIVDVSASPPLQNPTCVKCFRSTSARPAFKSVTLAGSCSALSTAFSPTARCRPTRRSVLRTTRSTRSSAKPAPASTCRARCSWTLSPRSWTRSARAPTASCSTRSS